MSCNVESDEDHICAVCGCWSRQLWGGVCEQWSCRRMVAKKYRSDIAEEED